MKRPKNIRTAMHREVRAHAYRIAAELLIGEYADILLDRDYGASSISPNPDHGRAALELYKLSRKLTKIAEDLDASIN